MCVLLLTIIIIVLGTPDRCETTGAPDGIAVDSDGGIWVAHAMQNSVGRYEQGGKEPTHTGAHFTLSCLSFLSLTSSLSLSLSLSDVANATAHSDDLEAVLLRGTLPKRGAGMCDVEAVVADLFERLNRDD